MGRLAAGALPVDVEILPGRADVDWAAVRALPEVESLATYVLAQFEVDGQRLDQTYGGPVPMDRAMFRDVERPAILAGRLADPTRADEAVVTSAYLRTHGRRVGDTMSLRLYQPQTVDLLAEDPMLPADGPTVEVRIVGVVRSALLGDAPGAPGLLIPSAGLFEHYAANLLGTSGSVIPHGLAHLDGGPAAMPGLRDGLTRVAGTDVNVWEMYDTRRFIQRTTGFEANTLLVLALVAGVAALVLVGQAMLRHVAASVADLHVLRALGLAPAASIRAAAVGPTIAAVVGAAAGAAAAVVASAWFPVGSAALFEPSPGFDIDTAVIAVGLVAVPILAYAGAAFSVRSAFRALGRAELARRSTVADALSRFGLPVPLVVGVRYALEPGRGRASLPVRPALAGSVVGVVGVLAAFTISSGVDDALTNPARFGQAHQLEVILGYEGADTVPAEEMLDVIAADEQVTALNDSRVAVAAHGSGAVTVYTFDPVGSPLDVVVTEGRLPSSGAEIMLAPYTAEAMGAGIGDIVELTGSHARELAVSGLGFVPEAAENYYVTGAWVTRAGHDALFDGFSMRVAHVALVPGADPAAVQARMSQESAALLGVEMPFSEPIAPDLSQLIQVKALPQFLAAFLFVLAVVAVGHAVAVAGRRRRKELGVLRALGLSRGQCRCVLRTQATVLLLSGLLAGIPLGVALGRTVWRYVAELTPVQYVPPTAPLALLLALPVALVVANLLAAWPAHLAAGMRPAEILRAE
ncbi:MAG: FtsX-like permease family protein [Jiangellaceae bacterium]